jgi:hypothetical protein
MRGEHEGHKETQSSQRRRVLRALCALCLCHEVKLKTLHALLKMMEIEC